MIRIAIPGVNGRMGRAVAQAVVHTADLQLVAAVVRDSAVHGTKVANSDVVISGDFISSDFDILIDFTLPDGVMQNLEYCLKHRKAMVIGATGFSASQIESIRAAAKNIPILMSANMSVAVNVCFKLLASAAKMLGSEWNVGIMDLHHEHKKDSPSGTSKHMASIVAENSGKNINDIKIDSKRVGEIVGTHIVSFQSPTDTITIAHEANDRKIFADGAVIAARWLYHKPAGLYSMLDAV